MADKKLYKGVFHFSHKMIVLHRYASTEKQARVTMCRYIAKQQGVPFGPVFELFDGSKANYTIREADNG